MNDLILMDKSYFVKEHHKFDNITQINKIQLFDTNIYLIYARDYTNKPRTFLYDIQDKIHIHEFDAASQVGHPLFNNMSYKYGDSPRYLLFYESSIILEILSENSGNNLKAKITIILSELKHIESKISVVEINKKDFEMNTAAISNRAEIYQFKKNIFGFVLYQNICIVTIPNLEISKLSGYYHGYIDDNKHIIDKLIEKNLLLISGNNTYTLYDLITHKHLMSFEKEAINAIIDNWMITNVTQDNINKTKIYKLICEDEIPDEEKCTICQKRTERKKIIIPCGHTRYCNDCITIIKICKLCNKNIERVIEII